MRKTYSKGSQGSGSFKWSALTLMQLTRMERMLQANLSNTQMAPCTGVHQTEASPVNCREAHEQHRRARTSGSGLGGLYGPSNPV